MKKVLKVLKWIGIAFIGSIVLVIILGIIVEVNKSPEQKAADAAEAVVREQKQAEEDKQRQAKQAKQAKEEQEKKIKDINSAIVSVENIKERNENVLEISIVQGSIFSGGNITQEILSGIVSNPPNEEFDKIRIRMTEILVDQFGKESKEEILKLTYPREIVMKINYENVTGWTLLNLSIPERVGLISVRIIKQECQDANNAKYAAKFCINALL
ncbi:MAG: hypothetical protein Q8N30_15670 [Methylococcales bacterium]|nr:hypothetical protein [Methylococcales bacterium]